MEQDYIRLSDVYKKFGNHKVLKGLSFSLKCGQTLALLGHNGAGKTTTLRILLGLLEIDSGEVTVFGHKVKAMDETIRRETGVLSEDVGLYESLTVYDNLKLFSDIYGCNLDFFENKVDYLLEKFRIAECKHKIIKNFSLGQKKKVAIIRTLFHNPKLVLMDEPVNALDPVSIRVLHEIMKDMKEQYGTTFIIATHNLDEVIKICDELVIVKQGKSAVKSKIEPGGKNTFLETNITIYDFKEEQTEVISQLMAQYFKGTKWKMDCNKLILNNSDEAFVASVIKALSEQNIGICEVIRNNFNLEQIYFDINAED